MKTVSLICTSLAFLALSSASWAEPHPCETSGGKVISGTFRGGTGEEALVQFCSFNGAFIEMKTFLDAQASEVDFSSSAIEAIFKADPKLHSTLSRGGSSTAGGRRAPPRVGEVCLKLGGVLEGPFVIPTGRPEYPSYLMTLCRFQDGSAIDAAVLDRGKDDPQNLLLLQTLQK